MSWSRGSNRIASSLCFCFGSSSKCQGGARQQGRACWRLAGPSCHRPSSWTEVRHLELGKEGACPFSWLSCATGRKPELSWTLVPSPKRPHEHGQAPDSRHQGVRRLARRDLWSCGQAGQRDFMSPPYPRSPKEDFISFTGVLSRKPPYGNT